MQLARLVAVVGKGLSGVGEQLARLVADVGEDLVMRSLVGGGEAARCQGTAALVIHLAHQDVAGA